MSKKLLLADDSITIQKVIGITFANEDYSLSVVDNGDAALERARAEQPDLILADVFMPGKNGYELCAAIKADSALQQIPVLLLAGTFEPFDEAKARKAGADGWIAKPFESQALIDRVEELLARPRTPVAPPMAPAPAAAPPVVPPVVAPVPPVMAVQPVEKEDTEPDLWAELGPMTAPILDAPEAPAAEPLAETPAIETGELLDGAGVDDLWGEVSLGEEDLVPVAATAASDDIWDDLDVPATAPMVEAPEPIATEVSDLWDDLPATAEPEQAVTTSAPASAAAAWEDEEDEVFLILEDDEEVVDLLEPSAEEVEAFIFVEDDELAQDLTEAAAQPIEAPATFVAAESGEEGLLELDDSDIMALDDADIVEEDDLELLEENEGYFSEPVLAEEKVAEGELELLEEPALVAEMAPAAIEESVAIEDAFDGLLGDLTPLAAPPEELLQTEHTSLLVDSQLEEEPLWDVVEPAMEEVVEVESVLEEERAIEAEAPQVQEPLAPVAPVLSAAAAEAQVQGLSEADLTRIVERVAGEVIEKLAGTILERMAWEVVPDLAESLIREEIRKIRDNVA